MWAHSAVMQRRRLARRLRDARVAASRTQQEIADTLQWPTERLNSFEDSSSCPTESELAELCSAYEISGEVQDLQELASESRILPFSELADLHRSITLRYFAHELCATEIQQFEPMFVPGLLQTRTYTLQILQWVYGFSEDLSSRIADVRERRQRVLDATSRPILSYFIDEAVISRLVGSRTVMREQLSQLREAVGDGVAALRLVPFNGGVHPGMMGPFTHLQFELRGDQGIVYVENSVSEFIAVDSIETPNVVASYGRAFAVLGDGALSVEQTLRVLARKINDLT
jgi:Domain of unknown function (DUF5753)/Helix-turn-helix domain